jgi:IS1 family transposase
VLARAGGKAGRFLDANVKNVQTESVQADELFCFVGCKQRNNLSNDLFRGDQYLFLAMDAKSKLIISHVIGKRTPSNALALFEDLKRRVPSRFQLTTDGYHPYRIYARKLLSKQADFAQLIKIYANPEDVNERGERRYSPSQCVEVKTYVVLGNPDRSQISTSYIERQNLNIRLFNRRFTRLTLGYSKKFEYLIHSINLMVFHNNFVRVHSHGQTPAQATGLTDKVWTFENLLLTPD